MAFVLRFDENHEYVGFAKINYIKNCGNYLCVCFSENIKNPRFTSAFTISNDKLVNTFYEENLPHKIKTFLLLGGLENAITNYTGNNNN